MKRILMILLLIGIVTLSACTTNANKPIITPNETQVSNTQTNNTQNTQIANPASVFCVDHGGTLNIKTADDGSQTGYCTIAGKECEEWSLFRGECTQAHICTDVEKQTEACTMEYMPVCGSDGKTYGNKCVACSAKADYWIQGECASNTPEENVCCESFGYGARMVKTPSTYTLIPKSQCAVCIPDSDTGISKCIVGGGRNIVNMSYCNATLT